MPETHKVSNYPNGFKNTVTIRGVPIVQSHPGQVFWVNSTNVLASDGVLGSDVPAAGTYQRPYATIDYAIGQCTANRGDIIMVMPGHTETVSAAGGITMDVAGVAVVGLGTGSLRPTITLDTASTATIAMSAANTTFKNCIFSAAFADIAEAITPSATNITIEDCDFVAAATNQNFLSIMDTGTTDNECDDFALIGCRWIEPDTATLTACSIDGDLDGLTIQNCYMNLGVNTSDLPILAIVATGKDVTNVNIQNNTLIRLNDANPLLITADTTTANTGVIRDNTVRHLDTGTELLVTAATNISFTNNLCSAAVDASGFLVPAADS
jgi:hypothetical protein